MSHYHVCIHRNDGQAVTLKPGSHGERELCTAIIEAAVAKGVGLFRTEAHVRQALHEAIHDVLHAVKAEVRP